MQLKDIPDWEQRDVTGIVSVIGFGSVFEEKIGCVGIAEIWNPVLLFFIVSARYRHPWTSDQIATYIAGQFASVRRRMAGIVCIGRYEIHDVGSHTQVEREKEEGAYASQEFQIPVLDSKQGEVKPNIRGTCREA
ncbi:hypothetical protein CLAIMM_10430 [Cladophialophora immunda]|nr:hypothetical protein CLAIMM_10430 [Cladophialophora immunda]